jgi:hypothetical protein
MNTTHTPGAAGELQTPPAVPGSTLGSRTVRAPGLGSAPAAVVAAAGAEPNSGPRTADDVAEGLSSSAALVVGAGAGDLPRLGEVVRDGERLAVQLINVLGRNYDPASGPDYDPWDPFPSVADIGLGQAVAYVRSALYELHRLTESGLPPVGSAVMFRPSVAGEGRTPGLVGDCATSPSEASGTPTPDAACGPAAPSGHDTPGVAGPTRSDAPVCGVVRVARDAGHV